MVTLLKKRISSAFLQLIISGKIYAVLKFLNFRPTSGHVGVEKKTLINGALVLPPYGISFDARGEVLLTNIGTNPQKVLRRTIAFLGLKNFLQIYLSHILQFRKADLEEAFHLVPRHGYEPNHPNYCHWLLEDLPKLFSYIKTGLNCPILINANPKQFQLDALECLKCDENLFTVGRKGVSVQKLHLVEMKSAGSIDAETDTQRRLWLRDTLLDSITSESRVNDRCLAIVRKTDERRKLSNFKEFETLCKEYGIEEVEPSDLSFAEQIEIFSQAKLLISVHGAGLANILFMTSGQVVEISHEIIQNRIFFKLLSNELNLNYFRSVSRGNCQQTEKLNDINEFAAELNEIRKHLDYVNG